MGKLVIVLLSLLGLTVVSLPSRGTEFVAEDVASKVKDSVVTVQAVALKYSSVRLSMGGGGLGLQKQVRFLRNYSTAFVLNKEGYLLAAEQPLRDVETIEVATADGNRYPADILVRDEAYGLALLKMHDPPPNLKPVKFADPANIRQGESVVVIGTAGGFGQTVSYGIISGLRPVRLRSGQLVPRMIQSDVVVNVGNQGSPLFDKRGEVIGVQAIFGGGRETPSLQNITFFMPSDLLQRVANEMMETGEPAFRPFLGIQPYSGRPGYFVRITELTDELRMYMDLPDAYWDVGVLIWDVWEGSSAYDAGLRYQDFIIKLDGKLLKTIGELEEAVYQAKKGQKMVFTVIRRHRIQEFEVTVGDHPDETLSYFI